MAIGDNTSYELTGAQVKDLANKIKAKAADNIFVGATSAAPGSKGLVPQPQAGDDSKFLKGDGTWGSAPSNFVTLDTDQTVTGKKTFQGVTNIQNGQGTGSLWIGGNVNASGATDSTRHLARIVAPSYADASLGATMLGFDTSGDSDMHVANKTTDALSFGGMKKITNATSPMAIGFCVANTRGATAAANKVYPLEMDASEARFNVRPNYNGTNLATVSDVPTSISDLGQVTPSNIDFSAFYRTAPDITSAISVPSNVETQIQELTLPAGTWLVLWGIRFSAQTSTAGITYAALRDSSGNLQNCPVNETTDGTHVHQAVSGTHQLTLTSNKTIYTTLTTAATNASVSTTGPTYLRAIRVG